MGAVGGEVGGRRETPVAATNSGIAEKSTTGIDAEGFAMKQICGESAVELGSAIVGAGAVEKHPLLDAEVVKAACDGAACAGSSGIKS